MFLFYNPRISSYIHKKKRICETTYCPLIEYCARSDAGILGSKHNFKPSRDIVEEVRFGNGDASPGVCNYEVFVCRRRVSLIFKCYMSSEEGYVRTLGCGFLDLDFPMG